jgi:hypothetical protein
MAKLQIYKQSGRFTPGVGVNPPDPKRCACGVWSREGSWSSYAQCSRPAKFDAVIEGQEVKVCATHRPDVAAAREAAKQARYDKERIAFQRQHQRPCDYLAALQKWGDLPSPDRIPKGGDA